MKRHQSVSVDGSKSDQLSRETSVKWIPTYEQARILRELYHNYGVKSPNVEQIQKISNRLRQYGRIEGKNVFYWFSNYKARERRKKRLTVDFPSSSYTTTPPGACSSITLPPFSSHSTLSTDAPSHLPAMAVCRFCDVGADATCSSPGVHAVGQMGSSQCPGSVLMEKSYQCYFMSGGGGEPVLESNKGWVMGLESPAMSHHTRVQKAKTTRAEIRTLPLFPIHTREQEKVEEEEEEEEEHQEGKQGEECGVRSFVAGSTPQQRKPIGHIPAFHLDGGRQQQEDHCCLELTLDSYHHVPLRST